MWLDFGSLSERRISKPHDPLFSLLPQQVPKKISNETSDSSAYRMSSRLPQAAEIVKPLSPLTTDMDVSILVSHCLEHGFEFHVRPRL